MFLWYKCGKVGFELFFSTLSSWLMKDTGFFYNIQWAKSCKKLFCSQNLLKDRRPHIEAKITKVVWSGKKDLRQYFFQLFFWRKIIPVIFLAGSLREKSTFRGAKCFLTFKKKCFLRIPLEIGKIFYFPTNILKNIF